MQALAAKLGSRPALALMALVLMGAGVFLAVVMYSSLSGIFLVLAGLFLLRRVSDPKPIRDDGRVQSRPSGGQVIGGFVADLEHIVTGQARAVPQIEEQYREPWAAIGDVTVEGLDEPIERPELPDRSRARL